ncbi:MAG TPA: hypothetical protein VHM01_07185 [Alphaproteobacteria bacterium]|nr:hypothetical protein [Alphaproteobacteria bacterium]
MTMLRAARGLAGALVLASCADEPPARSSQTASVRPVAALSGEAVPSAVTREVGTVADALRGRVLVTGFTNPAHGDGVAEVIYYGRDGTGVIHRVAARSAQPQTFRWDVRARRPAGALPYVFISGDGRDDGAAVTYSSERQSVTFSDVDFGRHFAYGILQNCWPSFVEARPPASVPACDATADATTQRRLRAERSAAVAMRNNQDYQTQLGLFTTRPGSSYTNSLGNTLTVRRVDGLKVTFTNQSGAEFTSYAMLYSDNPKVRGNDAVKAAIDQLFPLELGKTVEAWVYNADWAWQLQWKVAKRESVATPAGRFDAWLIEHTETAIGAGYIGRSDTWYAPAIGWNVRYRSWTETPPGGATSQWELTRARVGSREYPQTVSAR